MSKVNLLEHIIRERRKNENKPRLSSPIKQWLGRDIPQSLSIRIGNYIEDFFIELTCGYGILTDLQQRNGQYVIAYKEEFHQVDLLLAKDEVIYHREIKCNLDLDRGKKRDVLYREDRILLALIAKYEAPIDSCVFCPFLDTSRDVSGLGKVEGLSEFIDNFDVDLTVEEFKQLGRNEQIHSALLDETNS